LTRSNNQQHGQRQSELANKAASDNHPLTRPPLLILIDAPLSSRLSRYSAATPEETAGETGRLSSQLVS
jgi:hypothetical protein